MKLRAVVAGLLVAAGTAVPATGTTRIAVEATTMPAPSFGPWLSDDGRAVAFTSRSDMVVPGDGNQTEDVFVRDAAGASRASVAAGGAEGDRASYRPSLSADGRLVAFESVATTLVPGDTNGAADVFLHDRATGTTVALSRAPGGDAADGASSTPSLNAGGTHVAFASAATNLVAGDGNLLDDIFVRDLAGASTTVVTSGPAGEPTDGRSFSPSISDDGRYVAFASYATNLVPGDDNGTADVFVHDRSAGSTVRVTPAGADGRSTCPSLSGDGASVAYMSLATNLVPDDTNGRLDAFVTAVGSGRTTRVSVSSAGEEADGLVFAPALSGDGRLVAFAAEAANLVAADTNGAADVFVHDRLTGRTERVSVASDGDQAAGGSASPSLSFDGRYAAFASSAADLVAGDDNGVADVFVHDRATGRTERLVTFNPAPPA